MLTATYSPEDNKLRLYSSTRLDKETYERVRAAGFAWAPKQDLFVAPMWTPARADLLIELAGEIGDEDTSLVDRAEGRADRFETYGEKRGAEAERAREAVDALADGIPLGQPILVGHHSEKRARKDAERIRDGMKRAVRLWETSKYWTARAEGALRHAKYKELPGVRQRRIKGLEADRRRYEREAKEAETFRALWLAPGLTRERALKIANVDRRLKFGTWSALDRGEVTVEAVQEGAVQANEVIWANAQRWIVHLDLRLAYERAMLGDVPMPPKRKRVLAPMANFPGDGYDLLTKAEWARIHADYKGTRVVRGARVRTRILRGALVAVFLTDSKRVDPPGDGSDEPPRFNERPAVEVRETRIRAEPAPTPFDAMKSSLRAGVKVVVADQLFPTPLPLAKRMVEVAGIERHHRVLEPSAGKGNLIVAIGSCGSVTAIEINSELVKVLLHLNEQARCADFLALSPEQLGVFDRIVMNPPFGNGADILHVQHARKFLKSGGRLVALVADGPRQKRKFGPVAHSWETLPEGSFASQGTNVRVAMIVIDQPGLIAVGNPGS